MKPSNYIVVTDVFGAKVTIIFTHVQSVTVDKEGECVFVLSGGNTIRLGAVNGKNFQDAFNKWLEWQCEQTVYIPDRVETTIDALNTRWVNETKHSTAFEKVRVCYKCGAYGIRNQNLEAVRDSRELKFQCIGGCKDDS